MTINKYIIFLHLACSLILKCNAQNYENRFNESTIEELLIKGINNPNDKAIDSIGMRLNELISNNPFSYRYSLSDSIDFNKNRYLLKISKHKYHYNSHVSYHIKGFEICIKAKDSIFAGGILLKEEQILDAFKGYCKIIQSEDISVETQNDSIPYFGYLKIPQPLIYLGVNIKYGNGLNSEEWKIYFRSLKLLIDYYNKLRNDISLKSFRKEFCEISPEKKIAILKFKPLSSLLVFDMTFCSKAILPSEFEEPEW